MNYPPKISDNVLALCEIKRKQLEWKFGSDKQIVTHNFFPAVESSREEREEIEYTVEQIKKNWKSLKRKNER